MFSHFLCGRLGGSGCSTSRNMLYRWATVVLVGRPKCSAAGLGECSPTSLNLLRTHLVSVCHVHLRLSLCHQKRASPTSPSPLSLCSVLLSSTTGASGCSMDTLLATASASAQNSLAQGLLAWWSALMMVCALTAAALMSSMGNLRPPCSLGLAVMQYLTLAFQ